MATRAGKQGGMIMAASFRANPRMGSQVVESPEVRAVLTMIALRVERLARSYAPVDTSRLRNSITHRVRTELGASPRVVAEVGTNVEYAAVQEFGTTDGTVPPVRYLGRALQDVARQLGGTM